MSLAFALLNVPVVPGTPPLPADVKMEVLQLVTGAAAGEPDSG